MQHALYNSHLAWRDGRLAIEDCLLDDIAAQFGTPCFVYSKQALLDAYQSYSRALVGCHHRIHYAMKANSNLSILKLFAEAGAGFDIVSGGELERVLAIGAPASDIVFSGVGKSVAEITRAIELGVACINIESAAELERVAEIASQLGTCAPISFRVNPDVDAKTHPYISTGLKSNKFGIAYDQAEALYVRAASIKSLKIIGIDCHIGSQLLDNSPITETATRILALVERLNRAGIELEHIDLGGGLGISYQGETVPEPSCYFAPLLKVFAGRPETLIFEPGRSLVGNSAVLLTQIEILKPGEERNFAIIDAAMNDLLRPAVYQAWHEITPTRVRHEPMRNFDVVGPICESSDFLGKDRLLAIAQGDFLAIQSAGAYAMSMSSNYNSRPRAAEVLVNGGQLQLIRRRETVADLLRHEQFD